ncbi:predicted protein [Aspergillus nidulans FGSC A4]|uniref:Uncharacterized protein n=1 Tax=Emericella nidulans (strain FGSC A4 / ATCC 38163 / CBS 112.46 / NRRL 194 / M139) TaxID=227321 RepID=Q5ARP0_EMENI|nr:hypothetical protein [Aspergillus nidulans FGSC A4]EAA64372.1 predicted protein [Aspergillus nidulans FGSC A4]CBF84408.1 TPA: conserved hypothetical protein [Aspergillus nidulans FGSC A4]|eukprot:XP_682309.1 predicted protein [Aspergillus nidulans FGSC A4]
MWLTRGFSRITETLSSLFCRSHSQSHSCSQTRERTRSAFNEGELEGESGWQTCRPRHLTERRLSGFQPPPTEEEYTSSFFHGWYLPYNVRGLSQVEPEPEPEPAPEADVELEDLPRYEHPPAYTNRSPPAEAHEIGSNSRNESLDVTECRPAPGLSNEPDTMAVTGQPDNAPNDRRGPT